VLRTPDFLTERFCCSKSLPLISASIWSYGMKFIRLVLILLFMLAPILAARAQNPDSYRGMLTARVKADKLPAPAHLTDYVRDGKLSLSLRDAILLTLENNSNVQIDETQVEGHKFA